MRKDPDSTDFWIHVSPQGSENFPNTVWKSKCEPIYDPKEKDYVHTKESFLEGDKFINLNPNALSLLSIKARENLRPGIRIHIVNGMCAEIKDITNELTEPIKHLYDLDENEDFEAVRDEEGIIFAVKGAASIHERKAFLITRAKGKKDVLRVDYVNESGKIIRHDNDKDVDESYIELGNKRDIFAPMILGNLWSGNNDRQSALSVVFVKAYILGMRFAKVPIKNEFTIKVKVLPDNMVSIDTNSDFYGIGNNLLFSMEKNYRSNSKQKGRSMDRVIVNGIISYRWFFKKPNLVAKVYLVHDEELESSDYWDTQDQHDIYLNAVKEFEDKGVSKLETLINDSVARKWSKRDKRNMHFDPCKINSYRHSMMNEEEG